MSVDILVYSGKHGDQYWLVDTPKRLDGAQRELFQQLDEQGCYDDDAPKVEEARDGDMNAIRFILEDRRYCEYEYWTIDTAEIAE